VTQGPSIACILTSGAPGNSTKEERLANLAESIHINPPLMMTMMEMEEPRVHEQTYIRREVTEEIDPHTGHRPEQVVNIVDDEAALQRATGPD